jgi:hypothetical protein
MDFDTTKSISTAVGSQRGEFAQIGLDVERSGFRKTSIGDWQRGCRAEEENGKAKEPGAHKGYNSQEFGGSPAGQIQQSVLPDSIIGGNRYPPQLRENSLDVGGDSLIPGTADNLDEGDDEMGNVQKRRTARSVLI